MYMSVCVVLVSLFYGISAFVGYLIPKPSLYEDSSGTIAGKISGFLNFPMVFVWKWT